MKLLGGAMSVALLAGLSVVTFEAANVGFENLIFQRTRPVAEAERDLVKAQNAQNTLKNEIARHDGVIAGLTADVRNSA